MPLIIEELVEFGYNVRATLTDLYPHPKSGSNPRITWSAEPVDATHVPSNLLGVRTMFSGFTISARTQPKRSSRTPSTVGKRSAFSNQGQAVC
jgi:hypothetical protein